MDYYDAVESEQRKQSTGARRYQASYMRLEDLDLRPLVLRPDELYRHRAHLVTSLNTLLEALARDECANESTRERITCTIRVDDLRITKSMHREDLRCVGCITRNNDGALRALGDDCDTRARCIVLGRCGEGTGDGRDIVDAGKTDGASVCCGLGLVADDDVGVGKHLLKLDLEELRDEGSGEVQYKGLSLIQRSDRMSMKGGFRMRLALLAADALEARSRVLSVPWVRKKPST